MTLTPLVKRCCGLAAGIAITAGSLYSCIHFSNKLDYLGPEVKKACELEDRIINTSRDTLRGNSPEFSKILGEYQSLISNPEIKEQIPSYRNNDAYMISSTYILGLSIVIILPAAVSNFRKSYLNTRIVKSFYRSFICWGIA